MTTLRDHSQGLHGLPVLAGLCSMARACEPGLGVESCVARWKRLHYALKRLHEIFTARITAEPIYELKTAFSHHAYLCAEQVQAIRERVGEMREPPLGLEDLPHPALEILFDEIRAAPATPALILGLYQVALPAVDAALDAYLAATHPIADAPSVRVARFARLECADMLRFGQEAIRCLVDDLDREEYAAWQGILADLLDAAGGLDGTHPATRPMPDRYFSRAPWTYDPVPRRDERFQDLYNQGVNPEAFLYDDSYPAAPKALMMMFKRLREIDVPEMMASILAETPDQPWTYYRDMSRQLWDEARHAMLGEIGFVALGVDWEQARITHNWSLRLNTECAPLERHAVLYYIEQGLMTRTGKRFEWEVAQASGQPLMATIQDFDWADEVLHAAIGREWYVPKFANLREALDYGDRCWSRIVSNWQAVREQGLTEHVNWWPAIYRQACAASGQTPDPRVLAYSITYESQRADLKDLTASG